MAAAQGMQEFWHFLSGTLLLSLEDNALDSSMGYRAAGNFESGATLTNQMLGAGRP